MNNIPKIKIKHDVHSKYTLHKNYELYRLKFIFAM